MRFRFAEHCSALSKGLRHQRFDGLWLGLIAASTLVAVLIFAFAGAAGATPTALDLIVTVRVYNYAQTSSTMLTQAEREASRILGEAGLKSVWLDCSLAPSTDIPQSPCPEPIGAAEIRLRILSVPVHNSLHDTAYGFAIAPALATVYSESASRFARNDEGEFEAPTILGCAIAHEIGHLLLGLNTHALSGVMSAHWERKHIRQALMGAMLFSPVEAKLIQAEMRRRMTVGDRQITIRIHDYAHANPAVLSRGERAVDDILQQAGVAAVWIDCSVDLPNVGDARCSRPVSPLDFVMNLLPRSKSDRLRRPAGVLGFAAEASGRDFGFIASIFYDVVKDCAIQRQQDFGELLGDAIAHELGHLLLGTNSHSSRGLMCAFWSGNQLRIAAQRGLAFSDTETQRIQAAMTARVLVATEFPQSGGSND